MVRPRAEIEEPGLTGLGRCLPGGDMGVVRGGCWIALLLLAGCPSMQTVRQPPVVASQSAPKEVPNETSSEAQSAPDAAGEVVNAVAVFAQPATELKPAVELVIHERPSADKVTEAELIPAPASAGPVPPVLTLHDLEGMALAWNPALAEQGARVRALRGNLLQVGLPPNPTAGYTASEIGDDGRAGQQGAYVGQEFVTGNKLGLNRSVAAQLLGKAEQEWAAMQQRVLTDVRTGYYEVLIAQERLAMTEQLAATSRQGVEAVEALLEAREAAGTDLLQARVESNTASLLVENAHAALEGAWRRLTAVVGNAELMPGKLAGDVRGELPRLEFEEELGRLLGGSPELAAARAEIDRAQWAVRRAYAEVVPNVNVQSSVQYDYATDDTIVGLQIGMPLPIINRNQGGIQEAQAELAAARWAEGRLELALRRRLATVYQQYLVSRQQVDQFSKEILPTVDETLRLTTEGYRAGEFGYLQLLTVQRTYFQTHLSYLDALGRMWEASRQIEGLLLSDSLESGQNSS